MWTVWVLGSLLVTASQPSTLPYGRSSGSMSAKRASCGIPLITIFAEWLQIDKRKKFFDWFSAGWWAGGWRCSGPWDPFPSDRHEKCFKIDEIGPKNQLWTKVRQRKANLRGMGWSSWQLKISSSLRMPLKPVERLPKPSIAIESQKRHPISLKSAQNLNFHLNNVKIDEIWSKNAILSENAATVRQFKRNGTQKLL